MAAGEIELISDLINQFARGVGGRAVVIPWHCIEDRFHGETQHIPSLDMIKYAGIRRLHYNMNIEEKKVSVSDKHETS